MQNFDCDGKSDEELVKLILDQDQEIFYCLMKRYEQKLLYYILRLSNLSKEEAEDILQEVFLKTYRNLNAFDQYLKFSSWIYRIAHNETISHFRKSRARGNVVSIENDENLLNLIKILPSREDLRTDIIKKETSEQVQIVLSHLPPKYREVLTLRYLEEKSYEEISDITRKPIGTVATLVNRAKNKLKEEILKLNIDEHDLNL